MAPTAPKKRPSIRTKTASKSGSGLMVRPHTMHTSAVVSDSFINSKRDKRIIKHSAFVNRIEKASGSKTVKRRRPNKKLVAGLESLGDALGEISAIGDGNGEGKGEGKIKMKTVKSRPGATKRREKSERMERERFGKNMAQLIGASTGGEGGGEKMAVEGEPQGKEDMKSTATSGRWAALRGFIEQTMEQKEEFRKT